MGKKFLGNERIGETRVMSNGLKATIVSYQNSKNMNIQFENGQTVYRRSYGDYLNGEINCPMIIEYVSDYIKITNPNLTKANSFIIDIDNLELIEGTFWFIDSNNYIIRNNPKQRLHRIITNAKPGEYVDHINGNTFDNRKCNLRICTNTGNSRNKSIQKNNKSGYKGVSWNKQRNKWYSCICVNNKTKSLGKFNTKEEAAEAYNKAAMKYYGEFARLNVIP